MSTDHANTPQESGGVRHERRWLADMPETERKGMFERLQAFYDRFAEAVAGFQKPRGSCAGCARCCTGPPFYMTCSDLEFEYLMQEVRGRTVVPAVHFEDLREDVPDKRRAFRTWACPFASEQRGCAVHGRRPFACRVFGPLAQTPIWWHYCAYQASPRIYHKPEEIPLWDDFAALIRSYRGRWGFVFPDELRFREYRAEVVEDPLASARCGPEDLRLGWPPGGGRWP